MSKTGSTSLRAEIVAIEPSPRKSKRFRVFLNNGKMYDFGLLGGKTFIDHGDETKKLNYWKRHLANKTEKRLIDNLIPSPALFSAYLLWNTDDLLTNIQILNLFFRR